MTMNTSAASFASAAYNGSHLRLSSSARRRRSASRSWRSLSWACRRRSFSSWGRLMHSTRSFASSAVGAAKSRLAPNMRRTSNLNWWTPAVGTRASERERARGGETERVNGEQQEAWRNSNNWRPKDALREMLFTAHDAPGRRLSQLDSRRNDTLASAVGRDGGFFGCELDLERLAHNRPILGVKGVTACESHTCSTSV